MKRTRLLTTLVALVITVVLASDALARNRMYHPTMGTFMQRDPLGTSAESPLPRNLSESQFTQRDPINEQNLETPATFPSLPTSLFPPGEHKPTEETGAHIDDGMNLYAYVMSNPLRYIDPSGMKALPCKGETKCCICLVFQEGTGNCEAAVYSVMKTRQNSSWADFNGETGFCAQADKDKTFTGSTAQRYKDCCCDKFAPNDPPGKAKTACAGGATDPTGGAQYFGKPQDWWPGQIKKGNCKTVKVPGCSLSFLRCKNKPEK